jgi:hypothetical protein
VVVADIADAAPAVDKLGAAERALRADLSDAGSVRAMVEAAPPVITATLPSSRIASPRSRRSLSPDGAKVQ